MLSQSQYLTPDRGRQSGLSGLREGLIGGFSHQGDLRSCLDWEGPGSDLGRLICSPVRVALYNLCFARLEVAWPASGLRLCAQQVFSSMLGDISYIKKKIVLEK